VRVTQNGKYKEIKKIQKALPVKGHHVFILKIKTKEENILISRENMEKLKMV